MHTHKHHRHLCHGTPRHLSPVATAQTHTKRERKRERQSEQAHVLHHQTVGSISSLGCQAECEQTDTDHDAEDLQQTHRAQT